MNRVLLVDDDPAMQETLAAGLRAVGYEVETCRDGRAVIPTLERTPCQLVILDVLIPHLNGFGVLEALRGRTEFADLPVIVVSGIYRRRNHRADMARRFSIVEYLDKPFSIAQLRELVEQTIGPPKGAPPNPKHTPPPVTLTNVKRGTVPPRHRPKTDTRLVEPAAQLERQEVERASREKFRTHAFSLQGSIRRNPVAGLLGKLWVTRRSGALLLRRDQIKKIIYFDKGNAYAVKSNLVSECLGRLLVAERLISEEECAASIKRMKESGRRQGEILVEMRSMTEKNLAFALELQLEAKLFEVFTWHDGEFRFNPSVELPPPGATLEWQGASLVVEGIRRSYDESRLRTLMLPILDVPLVERNLERALVRDRGGRIEYERLGFHKTRADALRKVKLPQTSRNLLSSLDLDFPDALRVVYSLIALEIWGPTE